jgi:hypothetical protein
MLTTATRMKALPATEFTLTWEGPAADDGEPNDAHFLGNFAEGPVAMRALLDFAASCHADWHGGIAAVRDGRGDLVLAVRLPLPAFLEVLR